MAKITQQGFIDDGSTGLTVQGDVVLNGNFIRQGNQSAAIPVASGSVSFPGPGVYLLAMTGSATGGGGGFFTGSVPSAQAYPGAELIVTDTLGAFSWMLTGSAYATNKALFVMPPTGSIGAKLGGTQLVISPSGSVMMTSDGFRWCVTGGSGSFTLTSAQLIN